jgi:transposase InsO family protein
LVTNYDKGQSWSNLQRVVRNTPTRCALFHSDGGIQYASHEFKKEIKQYEVLQSMSRKGNSWDKEVAENFFKILKSEMFIIKSILHAKTMFLNSLKSGTTEKEYIHI